MFNLPKFFSIFDLLSYGKYCCSYMQKQLSFFLTQVLSTGSEHGRPTFSDDPCVTGRSMMSRETRDCGRSLYILRAFSCICIFVQSLFATYLQSTSIDLELPLRAPLSHFIFSVRFVFLFRRDSRGSVFSVRPLETNISHLYKS